MSIIQNIFYYFQSLFEILTFRRKPSYTSLSDVENQEEYESIIFYNGTEQIMNR